MRRALYILLCIPMLWLCGFILFVETLPVKRAPERARTDAIIVLTGGQGRVEQGLQALAEGKAPVLFISGVGHKVTLQEMISSHSSRDVQARIAQRRAHVVLDYVAVTTQSNASEAASFVAKNHIRTARLVTAYYHMPRSLAEFRAAMPGVTLLPDPVLPPNYERDGWWRDEPARRLMVSEFNKFIAARLRSLLP